MTFLSLEVKVFFVICNNPKAVDTSKGDDAGKADTHNTVMIPAQILSCFL